MTEEIQRIVQKAKRTKHLEPEELYLLYRAYDDTQRRIAELEFKISQAIKELQ